MRWILPAIVVSQFLCTSLWFAGNAILPDIAESHHLLPGFLAHLTSAVQFGFISGTLVFALLSISDRFSPSRVFCLCAWIAALCNLGMIINEAGPASLIAARFLTGFFLAGIYPVGMKIAADYYQQGLGKSLGFLVGALVLGTAFPHFLKSIGGSLPWKYVVMTTSGFSVAGGLIMLSLVRDGPYRKQAPKFDMKAVLAGFRSRQFRSAAFGYFGHMWELYTFWAFVPVMLEYYVRQHPLVQLNVAILSFGIIASGSLACALAGYLSQYFGAKRIAMTALGLSGSCCLLSPIFLGCNQPVLLVIFLFLWGIFVIADSPLFSSLVANNALPESKGTALTFVNCIGFSITIVSIQLVNLLIAVVNMPYVYLILAAGPVLGLVAMNTTRMNAAKGN